jgi:hypothetical protein
MVRGATSAWRLMRPKAFDASTELTVWGMVILLSGKYEFPDKFQVLCRAREDDS